MLYSTHQRKRQSRSRCFRTAPQSPLLQSFKRERFRQERPHERDKLHRFGQARGCTRHGHGVVETAEQLLRAQLGLGRKALELVAEHRPSSASEAGLPSEPENETGPKLFLHLERNVRAAVGFRQRLHDVQLVFGEEQRARAHECFWVHAGLAEISERNGARNGVAAGRQERLDGRPQIPVPVRDSDVNRLSHHADLEGCEVDVRIKFRHHRDSLKGAADFVHAAQPSPDNGVVRSWPITPVLDRVMEGGGDDGEQSFSLRKPESLRDLDHPIDHALCVASNMEEKPMRDRSVLVAGADEIQGSSEHLRLRNAKSSTGVHGTLLVEMKSNRTCGREHTDHIYVTGDALRQTERESVWLWYSYAMSGHSKWSQIKRQKGVTDGAKSKAFGRFAHLIALESKKAAGNVSSPGLATVIARAKAINMPKDSIDRAVAKGTSKDVSELVQVVYEWYGPGGTAIVIDALTDNTNRTTQEIKHLITKSGFELGTPGSALWAFTKPGDGSFVPNEPLMDLSEEDEAALGTIFDQLDENDDVQRVFTNARGYESTGD